MNASLPHEPVLYNEIILALKPSSSGLYVDCTVGAGGHAAGILAASQPKGLLLGLEVDPQAIQVASRRLSDFGERAILIRASYVTLEERLQDLGWEAVDGILLDLGVSSMQLDSAERGFSFRVDAPLDMRYDPTNPVTAADLVNSLPEKELADLIYELGEERFSRRIARAIVKSRPITTTMRLAEIVSRVVGARSATIHPATRTFQALRIVVNHELDSLKSVLPQAIRSLAPGGRLAVISFHSLEDRIVKDFFRQESRDCICPPKQPVCICGHKAMIREITRRPIRPGAAEVDANPRARSARLRVAERLLHS